MAEGVIENDPSTGRFLGKVSALTDQQARYVREYVRNGGNATAAALSAGYKDGAARAWELKRNPAVLSAIRLEQSQAIADGASVAWGTVMRLMSDPEVPAPVQFAAAKWTLEASGHGLAAQAVMAKLANPESKQVSEMTVAELEDYVKRQAAAVEALKQAEGKVIEEVSAP